MFTSLSRGSSRVRQAYICSSCLSNSFTHHPPATVDRAPRAISFYSTSNNAKSESNKASELVGTPETKIAEDGKTVDTADASDGDGAKEGNGSSPKIAVSRSREMLSALRTTLAGEVTPATNLADLEKIRSKRALARTKNVAARLEKVKKKKEARVKETLDAEKAEKKSDNSKSEKSLVRQTKSKAAPPSSKSLRDGKGEVSTTELESQNVKDSTADSAENQDGKKRRRRRKEQQQQPLTRPALVTASKGQPPNQTLAPLNPSIEKKIEEIVATTPDGQMGYRNALINLIQGGQLSALERKIILTHLKSSIIRKRTSEGKSSNRSLKSAMLSAAPFPRRSDTPGPLAARRSPTGGRARPKPPVKRSKPGPIAAKPGMTAHEIETIEANELQLVPIDKEPIEVPNLSYGLERVLFNPGVYHLQDPRSRVFNFDPYLQTIMPVNDFDFNALKQYITSSKDKTLLSKAKQEEKKYTGSTSSMTSALGHFHFLLSQWRPINTGILSQMFPVEFNTFTALQRGPVAVFLRWRDGTYAIDADKEYDAANILMMLGKSMEKLLTLSTDEFEKYRKANSDQISEEQRNESEPFHYTTIGDFLLRSQLDAHDSRLPGTGMFDLKTRAVVGVRMDTAAYQEGKGYQIRGRHGEWESFEREYYDMIRAAFLKYSLQVRMGRMDGIFVAFHNTERIFGFQYISLPEMDSAIHGTDNTAIGDSEFNLSLELLNRVLDRATAKFPEKSLRLHFETRDGVTPFMYIFAEPVEEEIVEKIQATNKQKIEEFERNVLGLSTAELTEEQREAEWASLRAKVEEKMEQDELGIEDPDSAEEQRSEELDEVSADEQQVVDDLLATTAAEEEGDEDEDEDELIEDSEEKDEDSLEEEEGQGEVSEEIGRDNAEEEGQDEEREETVLDDANEDLDEQAVFDEDAADEIVEERDLDEQTSAEDALEDITNADEIFVEEESNGDELDSPESEGEDAELIENKTMTPDETSSASIIDEAADASAAANTGKSTDPPKRQKPLLAMTLTIRNKVNDHYVERPNNLQGHEKWAVEYALSEVPQLERAHALYRQLKTRRFRALTKSVDTRKDAWNDMYIENIKKLSRKGKAWREKQDKIEAELPIRTLDVRDGKKMNAKDWDVWKQGKQEKE